MGLMSHIPRPISLLVPHDSRGISSVSSETVMTRTLLCSILVLVLACNTDPEASPDPSGSQPPLPTPDGVVITPDEAFTDTSLRAEPVGWERQEGVETRYQWTVDGAAVGTPEATLGSDAFSKGQQVVVTLTLHRGDEQSDPLPSIPTVIQNSPPTVPTVRIEPADATGRDDLRCALDAEATDADDDALDHRFSWLRDGAETGITTPEVAASLTVVGEEWTCRAVAADEEATGPEGEDSVVVQTHCDELFVSDGVELCFLRVPAGEDPLGRYTLTRDFLMTETEVRQDAYAGLVGTNPSSTAHRTCGEDCPVDKISWHDSAAFANRLSDLAGLGRCYTCDYADAGDIRTVSSCTSVYAGQDLYSCPGYRLPTEAEWEYATRAGTANHFWTLTGGGDLSSSDAATCTSGMLLSDGTAVDDLVWHCGSSGGEAQTVGSLLGNDFGLHDLPGSAWEWCHDLYDSFPPQSTDPVGTRGTSRALRGGGYGDIIERRMKTSNRNYHDQNARSGSVGIRLVRTDG